MGRGTPTVISGAKGPQSFPDDPSLIERAAAAGDEAAAAHLRSQLGMLARGEARARTDEDRFVIFGSRFRGLTVQITSPEDVFNPLTGIRTRARPIKLKFQDYICKIRRDHPQIDLILARVKECPSYGMGLDFWMEADFARAQTDARYRSVVSAIKQDPELRSRLMAEFAEGKDFELPAAPPAKPEEKTALEQLAAAQGKETEPERPTRRIPAAAAEESLPGMDDMSEEELEAATAPA